MWTWFVSALLLLASNQVTQAADEQPPACLDDQAFNSLVEAALGQLQTTAERRQSPTKFSDDAIEQGAANIPDDLFPNSTDPATGKWLGFKASKWTSGYLSGCYWLAYRLTGDEYWADLAAAELPGLAPVASEYNSHKVSHIFDSSYGEALASAVPGAPVEEYQQVMHTAADSLAKRYSGKVGAIQSWNDIGDEFLVIIDSIAALKLMFEAAATPGGKQSWANKALKHARRAAQGLFRPDGSTFHVAQFNRETGEVEWQGTHQGYADNSTWARGQAWAVVGYTHVYHLTREADMLATAQRAADYFLLRLAEAPDGVPPWDFDVPPEANKPWKDSSAAAIAASGLLRLGELSGLPIYTQAGARLLASLAEGYLGWDTSSGKQPLESLLRNGTFNMPKGHHSTGLIWGDYYLMDALLWTAEHNITGSCG